MLDVDQRCHSAAAQGFSRCKLAQPVFRNGRSSALGSPGTSAMKRCLVTFAISAILFAPVAHANDALEVKVRAYVPVFPSAASVTSRSMTPPRLTIRPCSTR